MTQFTMLRSTRYSSIPERGALEQADEVRRELQVVIDSQPTQIHPDDREGYINTLLSDLEDREDAPWTRWSEDLLVHALTALKFLGRNPMGSQTLLSRPHLLTLLHHSALPFPPPASPFSHAPHPPGSAPATETLKVLANTLVLHEPARRRVAAMGGAKALARALAGKGPDGVNDADAGAGASAGADFGGGGGGAGSGSGSGSWSSRSSRSSSSNASQSAEERERVERVFLLARLAFLVSAGRSEAVVEMVEKEDMVESLVYHLGTLAPIPANYLALTELFKLANNITTYSDSTKSGNWDERLDPLLQATLHHAHLLPLNEIVAPLSHALHVFFTIPFIPRLMPTWKTVPDPPSPSAIGGVKSLIHKISQLPLGGRRQRITTAGSTAASSASTVAPGAAPAPGTSTGTGTSSGASASAGAGQGEGDLGLSGLGADLRAPTGITRTRSKSPSPAPGTHTRTRTVSQTHTRADGTALPARVLKLLSTWLDTYLPFPAMPDDMHENSAVDEILPPVILLLARAAEGDGEFRAYLKGQILPADLDRTADSAPLEARKGVLGCLLRLMHSGRHFSSRDSAGELLWAICDSNASILSAEIGYGNAAGFLFQKGVSAPPEGRIEEIASTPSAPPLLPSRQSGGLSSNQGPAPAPAVPPKERHPITSLQEQTDTGPSPFEGMDPEEKEREAERLYSIFKRLESNPVLSLKSGDGAAEGGDGARTLDQVMRGRIETGEMERWERGQDEEERRVKEKEEDEDERKAVEEVRRLRAARGKKEKE